VIAVGGEALIDLVGDDGALRPVAGGGPLNTAIALARLAVPVAFLGTLSQDHYGTMLARLLIEAGVDTSLVRWSSAPTPLAVVNGQGQGESTYTFYLNGTSFTDFPPEAVTALPEQVWGIHVGTLGLAIDPPASAYEALLDRERGRRTIVFDPNVRPTVFGDQTTYRSKFERVASAADVVKLSDDDAAWIYPELEPPDVLERVLSLGPRLAAITMSTAGAVAASRQGQARVPALAVTVADTVGAGDSFGAALLAILIERKALGPESKRPLDDALLEEAITYAVTASAITCTRRGAVPPSLAEIDSWLVAPQRNGAAASDPMTPLSTEEPQD
jgi:fructokinase